MGRPVAELYPVMTADELCHWAAIDRITPIGDERNDWLFANLCAVVCSVAGAKRKSGGPFSAADFLIFRQREEPKPMTPRSLVESLIGHLVTKKPKEKS